MYVRLCSLDSWQRDIYSFDWRQGQCSVGCHHGTILCKSMNRQNGTFTNNQPEGRHRSCRVCCSSILNKNKSYLRVMTSKLPVCSRASITARSLASEPLLVRYTTFEEHQPALSQPLPDPNKEKAASRRTFRGSGRWAASFSQYSCSVGWT